jgi:hypothetical protein
MRSYRHVLIWCVALWGCGGTDGPVSQTDASGGVDDATMRDGSGVLPMCEVQTDAAAAQLYGVTCFPPSAVPSGSCTIGRLSCQFTTCTPCAPAYNTGPRTFWACRCVGERWVCDVTSLDEGVCPPWGDAKPAD